MHRGTSIQRGQTAAGAGGRLSHTNHPGCPFTVTLSGDGEVSH